MRLLFVILFTAICLYQGVFSPSGFLRLVELQGRIDRTQLSVSKLQQSIEDLQVQKREILHGDREKIVREQLGWIRPGEFIVEFE